MFEKENIDSQQVTVIAIFGAFAVFVAIVAIQVVFYRIEKEAFGKRSLMTPTDYASYRTEQETQLTGRRWVSQADGIGTLPIDVAMQKVRASLNASRE